MQIAVSSWSFHTPLYAGSMRLPDVPDAARRLGIRAVELNDVFLTSPAPGRIARLLGAKAQPITTPDYGRQSLMRLRQGRLRSGARLAAWTIDTDLTADTEDTRNAQRAYLGTAIEAARFLGAPILRLTLGNPQEGRPGVGRAIDLLRSALPAAIASGIRFAVENHGGLSSDAGVLEEIVEAFRAGREMAEAPVGVCLDFSHFAESERVDSIARLAPLAIHAHAHTHHFDARGEETRIDYRTSLAALRSAGYDGAISIEYGGDRDPVEGIDQTRALIEKYWNA